MGGLGKRKAREVWHKIFKKECYQDGPPLWHASYEDKYKWKEKCNACPDKKRCHRRQWNRLKDKKWGEFAVRI